MTFSSCNGACTMIFLVFLLATHDSSVAAFSVSVAPFGIVNTSHRHHRQAFTFRQTCKVGMVSSESTSTSPAEAFSAEFQQKQQLLEQALKRPGKTLAVALEYHRHPDPDPDPAAETASDSSNKKMKKVTTRGDLATLSMQLRKAKVSALVTADLTAAAEFVAEQASAAGNFPGPCPVIYCGDRPEEAAAAGVTAVVLSVAEARAAVAVATSDKNVPIIWKVDSCDDVTWVMTAARKQEGMLAFLIDAGNENAVSICEALPVRSVVIASMDAMMFESAELSSSRALVKTTAGVVTCILLRQACVGDVEDIEYASFAISGLSQKRSSTFNMSGLTGSTNGHFGGVGSSTSTTWLRKKQQRQ
jgi:hypothetical protein